MPVRQDVRVGDRVRTGRGASARLVYFEGTTTELGADTGVLVQRLERGPGGGIVGSLFQSVGTTVSRVVQLADPGARFEIETPAATALVRGTQPEVAVLPSGRTRVRNVPDGTSGLVVVRARDPNLTEVTLQPGQETVILPGQRPAAPDRIGAFDVQGPVPDVWPSQQQEQVQRQQRRAAQIQRAQQEAAQAQSALAAVSAEAGRLAEQERALQQQIATLVAATPTAAPNNRQRILPTLTLDGNGPCATALAQVCQVGRDLQGSTGTVVGSMLWRIVVPPGLVPSGAMGTVFIPTTQSFEAFDCPPAAAATPTVCTGTTVGNGRLGGTVRVFANNAQVAQGPISGPGTATPTPHVPVSTATPAGTATATTTATMTPAGTATATTTATVTPTATPTATPTPTGPCPATGPLPAGPRVYVTNQILNCVFVVDANTNAVLGTIPVAGAPRAAVVNPAGTRLYVANFGNNTVAVIDTATNAIIATVPVGIGPRRLAIDPSGSHVYTADNTQLLCAGAPGTVSVIDTATNTRIATVTVGVAPLGVAVNPAGTRAYTANGCDSVSVIDISNNTVLTYLLNKSG